MQLGIASQKRIAARWVSPRFEKPCLKSRRRERARNRRRQMREYSPTN
jgi:hypothetical protein